MVPAGGHASSIADMARFMIAHLQDGRYSDGAAGEFAHPGGGYGGADAQHPIRAPTRACSAPRTDCSNSRTTASGRSGTTAKPWASGVCCCSSPEQSLGVFVAYNSETAGGLELQHLGFQRAFFDHYYPAPAVEPIQPPADFAERAGRFEGSYQLTRMSYTTLEKSMEFFGGNIVRISSPGDGTLLLTTGWGVWRFVEVEPLYFRQEDGAISASPFVRTARGASPICLPTSRPCTPSKSWPGLKRSAFNMGLLAACTLIFLSMIAAASIGAIRSRPPPRRPEGRASRRGGRRSGSCSGSASLNVLFVGGMFLWNNPKPMFGVSTPFQIVLGLGVLSAALTAGALALHRAGLEGPLLGRGRPRVLHAGDGGGGRVHLVPGFLEPARLAFLAGAQSMAGGDAIAHPPAKSKEENCHVHSRSLHNREPSGNSGCQVEKPIHALTDSSVFGWLEEHRCGFSVG